MAEDQQNQTPPATGAPHQAPVDSPEPDIDSLLTRIPELKGVFGDSGEKAAPKEKEPSSEAETGTVEEIQEGLDPALPIEEVIEEPEPEPEEEGKPEKQDSVQKRIDKITAARRAAEEEATALKAELADLKAKHQAPPPVVPTAQNPLANVETNEELSRRVGLSRQAKSWAIQHLDGGEIQLDDDGNTKFLSGEQVKVLLSRAEEMLEIHIPQRHQFLQQKADWDKQAKAAYPNLYKPGHKDNVEMNSWLTVFPECRRFPDIGIIVGDAILGRQLRLQREAAKKNGGQANGNNLPLSAPAPAAAPRVPRNRALSGAELSAIATDPSSGALDKFVTQLIADAEQSRPTQRTKR